MMTNSDVTIFNLRIGADRREKLCATRIMGVSWYGTKGETACLLYTSDAADEL